MKITKCIIPIAGKGTRFLPITKTVSKEMLPIVNYPTILLQVMECYKSGIEEIIFVVGDHNKDLIKNFFTKNQVLEDFLGNDSKKELLNEVNEIIDNMKIHYVMQDENVRGTSGAIYSAKDYIAKDEFFGVIFGDDLFDAEVPALKQLILENEKNNCNVCGIGEVPDELVSKYGIVKYKLDNIVETIIEKPKLEDAPSNDAIQGRYIIHGTIFDKVLECEKHENNEYYLMDALFALNEELRAVKMIGTYYDIGSYLGYIKANVMYGLKKDSIKEELKEFLKIAGE